MPLRDLLLILIVFGALPWILARPYVGVLMFAWLGYMNPHRMAWGLAYDFPFAQVVALVTLVGLLFSRDPKRIPWASTTILWLTFLAWTSITTLFALAPNAAVDKWNLVMKIQLMSFVTLMVMGTRERLHLLTWVIVVSMGFFGVKGGMFSIFTGGAYRVYGPEGSFIEDNNDLAFALVMVLPLMRYLQLESSRRVVRWALSLAMVLTALSVLSSYSRGAFLAAAAAACAFLIYSPHRAKFALVLVVLVPALFAFMPEHWLARMQTIPTYDEDPSALGRINAWWFAFNLALDRPMVGGGYSVFQRDLFPRYAPDPEDFHGPHSIYFEVLAEHGFIGLALFLVLGLLAFRMGLWILRNTRDRPDLRWAKNLSAMLIVSLVGYAVGGAFLGRAYFDLTYQLLAMLVLTHKLVWEVHDRPGNAKLAGDITTQPRDLNVGGQRSRALTRRT
jgi:probable O-glycosylation ligase (exosortase A-associated)